MELHKTNIDMRISKIERRESYTMYGVLELGGGTADHVQIAITHCPEAPPISSKEVIVRAFEALGKEVLCIPSNPIFLPEAGKGKCSTAFANFILQNHDPKVIQMVEVSYAGIKHNLVF